MQIEILKIEEQTAKNGSKYLALNTKHIINTDKNIFVFVSCVKFKEYEDILKNFKVGDGAIVGGEFRISNYKDKENGTYKNSYNIVLDSLINIKEYNNKGD